LNMFLYSYEIGQTILIDPCVLVLYQNDIDKIYISQLQKIISTYCLQ